MSGSDLFLFVSHLSEDRAAALQVVAELERRSVRCWIAPRNVRAGRPFDDEIANAIDGCRAMLLIFSERCNDSEYIRREVTVAVEANKIVIPFRIENAQPKRGLRVRLADLHWIDAFVAREQAIDEAMLAKVRGQAVEEVIRTLGPDETMSARPLAGGDQPPPAAPARAEQAPVEKTAARVVPAAELGPASTPSEASVTREIGDQVHVPPPAPDQQDKKTGSPSRRIVVIGGGVVAAAGLGGLALWLRSLLPSSELIRTFSGIRVRSGRSHSRRTAAPRCPAVRTKRSSFGILQPAMRSAPCPDIRARFSRLPSRRTAPGRCPAVTTECSDFGTHPAIPAPCPGIRARFSRLRSRRMAAPRCPAVQITRSSFGTFQPAIRSAPLSGIRVRSIRLLFRRTAAWRCPAVQITRSSFGTLQPAMRSAPCPGIRIRSFRWPFRRTAAWHCRAAI